MEAAQHTARIRVQGAGFWCEGDVVVPAPSAYRGRVHDVLNRGGEFLALTDVDLYKDGDPEDKEPELYDVLIVRKGEIKFVVPLD